MASVFSLDYKIAHFLQKAQKLLSILQFALLLVALVLIVKAKSAHKYHTWYPVQKMHTTLFAELAPVFVLCVVFISTYFFITEKICAEVVSLSATANFCITMYQPNIFIFFKVLLCYFCMFFIFFMTNVKINVSLSDNLDGSLPLKAQQKLRQLFV